MKLNKIPKAAGSQRKKVEVKDSLDAYWPMMKEYIETGKEARRPAERKWILNLAFLHGRQYTFFNTSAHMLQQIGGYQKRLRIVDNQILPKWRRQVNDLIRTRPKMSVVPSSNQDEDIQAAKTGDKVIKHFWRANRVPKKLRKLGGWIYSTGNAFLADTWNPSLGKQMVDQGSGQVVYEGDADLSVWSPFEVLVPTAFLSEIHDGPWLIKHRWRSLHWIEGTFKRGGEVKAEDRASSVAEMTYLIDQHTAGRKESEGAYVYDLYIKPCKEFPKGKFLVGANGIILFEKEFPANSYPLEHFKDIDIPGMFWGEATMTSSVPLQVIWNKTLTAIYDHNQIMARGKWMVPRGAEMEAQISDSIGEILEFTVVQGREPKQADLKGIPGSFDLLLSAIRTSMEDNFSQHEVSRGTNKSDIRSGEMVSLLREQDAIGVVGTHAIFEESLEAVMGRILRRIKNGYKSERMLQIKGDDDEFEVFAFQGADLRDNTDVSVVKESSLSDSKVARQAQIMQRWQAGLYGDPLDPEVRRHAMKMLDDAVVKDIYSDTVLDETYARYENKLMASGRQEGQVYLINEYDNHGIHLREHKHYRKKLEHQKIRWKDPKRWEELEITFMKHEQMHQKFVEEAQAKQLAMMAQAKGGGAK
jgi:hypothetical protein